jgi:hypothetical protein
VKIFLFAVAAAACNQEPLDGNADLGANTAEVVTCCGGAPPECLPPADGGGCEPPLQHCNGINGSGCYLPCTPPPNFSVAVPVGCVGTTENLCKCIMENGGMDPCYPNGGSSCEYTAGNLPPNQIQCICL